MKKILYRIPFHKDGRPRNWLKALLANNQKEVRSLWRRVVYKRNGSVRARYHSWLADTSVVTNPAMVETVENYLDKRWSALRPLVTFPETHAEYRINLVTDSIRESSLFGGVGTALLLAVLLAEKSQAPLRIITRLEPPDSLSLAALLKANDIEFSGRVEFQFAPHYGSRELPVCHLDLFISTSWWTTRCLLNTVPHDRIVYLLQEDERMFYPMGDDQVACGLTLAEPVKLVVVNTKLLHASLTDEVSGIPGLLDRSVFFEPAFSARQRNWSGAPDKRQLFFYARPNNLRNLYLTGLRLIEDAVSEGILNPEEWKVHLVGHDLPKLEFSSNLEVEYHKPMHWEQYLEFLRGMDAGISLMHTPHPSYPPLDLASMGIPVLTNAAFSKRHLSNYSNNIICAELNNACLIRGLSELVARANDLELCRKNVSSDNICRSWRQALSAVVEQLNSIIER
ncbi:hypothetical protein G6L97_21830 [Agrobacterium tumefaciens]|uniref:rhamnosyltransferase WsaF family glycosyltransferase n=1 Tax=Agrobacterium tumefaciens TaxID=358 RepID=UPI001572254B|nr:hypothetical protein [Agrobacterium tumefaciens]NSZ86808.1 hypothetical protein [Agrobacterium tumefaciens]WCA71991.1 hypothetical protein G6L97_21830 [Agrobacterium tumefaciens]